MAEITRPTLLELLTLRIALHRSDHPAAGRCTQCEELDALKTAVAALQKIPDVADSGGFDATFNFVEDALAKITAQLSGEKGGEDEPTRTD